ncbi:MAG TPA: DUF951 domain-containing protein [Clostridiales bacterium]|nr:DUF951 domain-containing protein [Clostridiales bacterium]
MAVNIQIGDRLLMKKPHPCGGKIWKVTRIGLDFRLVCETCGREILIPRVKAEKGVKRILPDESVTNS